MRNTFWVLAIYFLLSCSDSEESQLGNSLTMAKGNRQELEKVLQYYKDDSLKFEAAKFLISNMSAHYTYGDKRIIEYYNVVDSILNLDLKMGEKRDIIEKMTSTYESVFRVVPDVEIIPASFLISNIDAAFAQWGNGEWATHVSFDDFCEYLLPYKSFDLQILDDWRGYLKGNYTIGLENLYCCDIYRNSAISATQIINSNLKNSLRPYLLQYRMPSIQRMSSKLLMPFGICQDYVHIVDAVLKSNGVPAAIDFTPQWSFRSLGHYWNVVLANNGKFIPFDGADSNPGEPFHLNERMAKVYRITYGINAELSKLAEEEQFIPEVFSSPCIKDVTKDYMNTGDISLNLEKVNHKYVYLAVFNDYNWKPVAFGTIQNGIAVFKDMGFGSVYLPVCYDKDGMKPIGDPFLYTYNGQIRKFAPQVNNLQTMSLYRKYPLFKHVYNIANRIVGGEFQAANNNSFQDAVVVHKIKKLGTKGEEVLLPYTEQKYRYWRYYNSLIVFSNIAEIAFVERESHLVNKGTIIGTKGSWGNNPYTCKEAAFDNDLLTWFDSPTATDGWVGIDFGKPVDIEKIIYTPRGDGNTIEIGDEYELFYWGNNQWNSLGRKTATTVRLNYDNVPSGTLYLLRDLTKGVEERIFEYKDSTQFFW